LNPMQLLARRRSGDVPESVWGERSDATVEATTRRAMLTGSAAAVGAALASTLVSSAPVSAASAVQLGAVNYESVPTVIYNRRAVRNAKALVGHTTYAGSTALQGISDGDGGTGVRGDADAGSTASGVFGHSTEGAGVRGKGTSNYGVFGTGGYCGTRGQGGTYGSISSGTSVGAYGSGSDYGLYGAGGTYGVYGGGSTYGVYGTGPTGVLGSGSTYGVVGTTTNLNSDAVRGSGGQYAVHGLSARTAGTRGDSGYVGAWGQANLYGVYGLATDGSATSYGVFGQASNNASYGVWCQGNMKVTGQISHAAASFKIDHPLEPERRWLSHPSVGSPDMLNVYSGNAVLDAKGATTVRLPRYFEALNRDFRYQLTALGGPAPSLHVSREIRRNAFRIAGGTPGQTVSWQVTGIRRDDYAVERAIVVETVKRTSDRGTRAFVPHGSTARAMVVHPAQPTGDLAPAPTPAPRPVEPRRA
jgi:hypothetical protein